jgi:hypothetical protein
VLSSGQNDDEDEVALWSMLLRDNHVAQSDPSLPAAVDRQIRAPLDPLRALDPDEQTFGA